MKDKLITTVRKLSQSYAYTSLQMHEAIARQAGLYGTDQKYLGFFLTKGSMTAGELAKITGLTTGAVTGLIDRFEKKGLVQRRFTREDRRKVIIEPNSENILALLKGLYTEFRERSEKLMASFTATELKTIESYSSKMIAIMEDIIGKFNSK